MGCAVKPTPLATPQGECDSKLCDMSWLRNARTHLLFLRMALPTLLPMDSRLFAA
jgi:hypothetical protein